MRLRSLISVAALAAAASLGSQVHAATVTVNVTLTIDAVLAINWCDTDGLSESVGAQSWALSAPVALSTSYHTVGGSPKTVIPTRRFIENKSNCTVDISAQSAGSNNWAVGASAGINIFKMAGSYAAYAAGAYTSLDVSVPLIADLANHNTNAVRSTEIGLEITTPASITIGGGRQQTIVVTFTAAADAG